MLSEALAETEIVPEIVEPFAGAVMETVGAVVSLALTTIYEAEPIEE